MRKAIILFFILFAAALSAREVTVNSSWQFQLSPVNDYDELPAEGWKTVNIPHSWNQLDVYDEEDGYFQGVGWYLKEMVISADADEQVYLKFEGANEKAEVFINGSKVTEHLGGYTAFVANLTPYVKKNESNIIAVRVDNSYNPNIPPLSADFTFYGGIYRDVYLITRNAVGFDLEDKSTRGVYITPKNVTRDAADLHVRAQVRSFGQTKRKLQLDVRLIDPLGASIASNSVDFTVASQPGTMEVKTDLSLREPLLWSPDEPNLYQVEVRLIDKKQKDTLDASLEYTAFRWFGMTEDRAFTLNGEPIKLVGVNRHQDFQGLGNELPDELHRRDMEILKEMGGNFIRIAHYPQDPAVLQACDELGIIVWEEIPIVNGITMSDEFTANAENMLIEMIRQHHNHPSVVMWGFMNEVMLRFKKYLRENEPASEEEYRNAITELTRHLNQVCKKEDPARWTTIAHHGNYQMYEKAGLNDITDIVGWNLYYGWYSEGMPRAGDFLDQFHQDHPDKGIIIAEYGGGSDSRIHAVDPKRFDFSIEWQTRIHASYYQQFLDRDHVMGVAIWNFADFNSEGRKDAVPHINSKGILNHDRTPKDSYLYYQAASSSEPYLRIGSLGWRKRAGFLNTEGKVEQPVTIFGNVDQTEVRLNGSPLRPVSLVDSFMAEINIPFNEGQNILTISNGEVSDEVIFQVSAIPRDLHDLLPDQIDFNMNLGSHFYYIDELTDEVWIPEQPYRNLSFGYVGGTRLITWSGYRVGTDVEIFGSDNEPVYQTHRDSIQAFRLDVPDGWYEITLHFAEIYSQQAREKLAYNLGNDEDEMTATGSRIMKVTANGQPILPHLAMPDFQGEEYRFTVEANGGKGIKINFEALEGSAFLSGIECRGL